MSEHPVIVWFRRDLRVADNPALRAAADAGRPVIPLFVWAPDEEAPWPPGAASRWWLHHALDALNQQLEQRNSRLLLRTGSTKDVLTELLRETGADTVYWNRLYEPAIIARDTEIKTALRDNGYTATSFNAAVLFEPWQIANKSGNPFQVFTPFWKQCLAQDEPDTPAPAPRTLSSPRQWPESAPLAELGLLPTINWDAGLYEEWTPGEPGAQRALDAFQDDALAAYKAQRDIPGNRGTSRLSPHLHFGEIGPRQIWHAVQHTSATENRKGLVQGAECYLREIGWREFAHHLLYHFPHTPETPLREQFNDFPWRDDPHQLNAWQRGRTGYPIVDAGLRELWHTGWLHNRVRMIVASFLVKDLLLSWQDGARWFWDTLVDADLASNTLGWQWAGGCGADAAPYFRIFNPILQGKKFDPDGAYVRHWIPELADLPDKHLHTPWEADPPPDDYPAPIIDHKAARDRALEAFQVVKQ